MSAALASAAVALAPPASAAPLNVVYDATGSSTIVKTGSTLQLGPSTLSVALAPDGTFTGSLPLPPTSTSFNALGLLPVHATVSFLPVSLTGQLSSLPALHVASTAVYYVRLSNVTVGGLPAFVGSQCRTRAPVSIPAATPPGSSFGILSGGTLTGTYTIGAFQHCGLTTALINLLVPGTGNTATLNLSNGRAG